VHLPAQIKHDKDILSRATYVTALHNPSSPVRRLPSDGERIHAVERTPRSAIGTWRRFAAPHQFDSSWE